MRRLFLLLPLFVATPALAAPWHVDPVTSRLMFEAEQAGETFEGSFPKFTSAIDFDADAPEKGKITITIDMARVQVDDKDRLEALPTGDWFAVKQFPTAVFTSTSISTIGSDKEHTQNYLLSGTLTIRGVSKAIAFPFSLKTVGTSAVARGEVMLKRNDYGVGIGRWVTDEWIKFPVKVSFEIHASR